MRYPEFKNRVSNFPIIASKDIALFKENKQVIRNQLNRWQAKGLIVKLKKGIYILNSNDRKVNPSKQFIANQLYMPSYVSLEYALNFYGLIPERVSDMTSVATRKTAHFVNELGSFVYQHIKPEAFKGFKAIKDGYGLTCFLAEPEKAVIDFLYLNFDRSSSHSIDVFENSYRFQNTDSLNINRIIRLSKLFNSDRLKKIALLFCKFVRRQKRH